MTGTQPTAPNGPIAAAILSAAIGCFTLGLTTIASDKSKAINAFMNFYAPSGALTGETTITIIIWIAAWLVLAKLWRNASIPLRAINLTAAALLVLGLLLTFPPFIDAL
jgi:hypothetical protein